jgi:hypothetical protein
MLLLLQYNKHIATNNTQELNMLKITNTRTNVTIDDRRAVIVIARNRKAKDITNVSQEVFIRRALKERLGVAFNQPAPDSIKVAAREMAFALDHALLQAEIKAKATQAEAVTA